MVHGKKSCLIAIWWVRPCVHQVTRFLCDCNFLTVGEQSLPFWGFQTCLTPSKLGDLSVRWNIASDCDSVLNFSGKGACLLRFGWRQAFATAVCDRTSRWFVIVIAISCALRWDLTQQSQLPKTRAQEKKNWNKTHVAPATRQNLAPDFGKEGVCSWVGAHSLPPYSCRAGSNSSYSRVFSIVLWGRSTSVTGVLVSFGLVAQVGSRPLQAKEHLES